MNISIAYLRDFCYNFLDIFQQIKREREMKRVKINATRVHEYDLPL